MTRSEDTIGVGIDLGTTNSAVAVVDEGDGPGGGAGGGADGGVRIVKNLDGWDTTPSAVWLQTPEKIHVGRRARDRFPRHPEDVAMEFKLEMGLADARRHFARAGVALTPPQLSAEVLRSLRADVAAQFGIPPAAAVITVPASFSLNQTDATRHAARLAGFDAPCPLVQEPTAAAFAWGMQHAADRAQCLVFDLGGGTFDAAVVSARDGELQVLHHAGDPYLGGKLIDWAIVEQVLAPAAARELGLPGLRRDDPRWEVVFTLLKAAAEDAKIALSRQESFEITVDLPVDGGEEPFAHVLTRGDVDRVAEPFYARAVALARAALTEGGLSADRVDRVLLVGGATLAPGLRSYLADARTGMGIELDVRLDPSTVVARGAALFAGTVRLERPLAAPTPGRFTVELSYEPTVSMPSAPVAGRLHAAEPVDWTAYTITVHSPDARPAFHSSPERLSRGGTFAVEVPVAQEGRSEFTLELVDPGGHRQQLEPDRFAITFSELEFGGARLTRALGIRLTDGDFAVLLRKGTTLPAHHREVFRTSAALRRESSGAVLSIPVVEGESGRADRNRRVGVLEVRATDVRRDLPASTEVEVTIEIDGSRLVTVVADVPLADDQFEAAIDLGSTVAPAPQELQAELAAAEHRYLTLRPAAETSGSPVARRILAAIDEQRSVETARQMVAAARVDLGAAAAADESLRSLQAMLDDLEDEVELPAVVGSLESLLTEAEALTARLGGTAERHELATLRAKAAAEPDRAAAGILKDRAENLYWGMRRRSPDWPVQVFYYLRDHPVLVADPRAAPLVAEAGQAIAAGDVGALSAVNQRLTRLLPADEQDRVGLYRP